MLRKITKVLTFRIGKHTQFLANQMNRFNPVTQQQIISMLKMLNKRKQYIATTPQVQTFVNKIQYFILKKSLKKNQDVNILSNKVTNKTLAIYKQIRHLNLLTQKFRYGMFKRISNQLISNTSMNVGQVENLLWFLYREYPFLRESQFGEIAQNFTLKLFDYYNYLHKKPVLGSWESYIRLCCMLQYLGHEIETRKDITPQAIQTLNYSYYPYLTTLITDHKSRLEYRNTHQISQPFLVWLCNKYIDKQTIRYDSYLQHIQIIDNQGVNEQIEKIIDPMSWLKFVELFELYAKCCQSLQYELDVTLAYKIGEFFWRLCETKQIQIQAAIRILEVISKYPKIIQENIYKIMERVIDTFIVEDGLPLQSYKFLPGNAYSVILSSVASIQERISSIKKQQLIRHLYKNISQSFIWEEGQKQQLLKLIELCQSESNRKWKTKLSQKTRKFLLKQNQNKQG